MTAQQALARRPSRYHGQRMSLEDYLALPEEKPSLEYWDGVVLQKAMGKWDHGRLQLRFGYLLELLMAAMGGRAATEIHSWFEGRGYRVPDAACWAPGKPQGTRARALPPTLAIEILSEGQSPSELRAKCRQMRANGVDVCWLILPGQRAAEVFDDGTDGLRLSGDAVLRSDHVPGFEVPLPELFAVLDRAPQE